MASSAEHPILARQIEIISDYLDRAERRFPRVASLDDNDSE
jgi:hypothetical protein